MIATLTEKNVFRIMSHLVCFVVRLKMYNKNVSTVNFVTLLYCIRLELPCRHEAENNLRYNQLFTFAATNLKEVVTNVHFKRKWSWWFISHILPCSNTPTLNSVFFFYRRQYLRLGSQIIFFKTCVPLFCL